MCVCVCVNGGGTLCCECTKNKEFRNLAAGREGTAGAGNYPDLNITWFVQNFISRYVKTNEFRENVAKGFAAKH